MVPEKVRAKPDTQPKTRLKVRTRGREIVLSADVDLTAQGSENRTVPVDVVKAYAGAGYRKC